MTQHPDVPLRALIKEDWDTHRHAVTSPGLHALVIHRLQVAVADRPGPLASVARKLLHAINSLIVRNIYGVELFATTVVGRRVRIAHHMGVILGSNAIIGDDCLIRQHVTLGQLTDWDGSQPTIGRGVVFGPGATVAGGVTIGDGATIGAHALVLKDVPAGATAMVAPARILPGTAGSSDSRSA